MIAGNSANGGLGSVNDGITSHTGYNITMSHKVTLIPGDGIGPEVSAAARRAVDATGVRIDWEMAELNADIIQKAG
ncbi:MAG: isocitrate dehydrogenase, partial [Bryobacterales bacterium]|nr:isocitrate dehydrogenase [Bryobacterales bacterium]